MEVRGRKGSVEISAPKPVGTEALRNFTIPRKKRVSGQVLLEPCLEDSHDYTLIQAKLRESRLEMRKEHANAWLWKDVKLIHNDGFLKEFSEKRSEMRSKGRHGREMEERFCFLAAPYEATSQIYQFGLRTGSQDQYFLGKSSHGVYLFKHVDVALKHATANTCSRKNLIVFKVLFGKVKKVTPCLEWNRTVDPMVGFDCHMAKDAVSCRDSLSQQVFGSSVFLFDYSENQELSKRPRQCLPYAVVSFSPAINATAPTSISPPVSPTKPSAGLMHEPSVMTHIWILIKL
ncbi:protein TASOR isoform X2 [Neoarius graeffei]|uniref:protein TASOR isoform X2 n=1 Tax=Neoarius graeffei TaxID=443677 RepID=UPI00298C2658|nr:protein TASOR isoform X2 [Neoarius graeffei]